MPHPAASALPPGFNPELYALGEAVVPVDPTPDQRAAVAGLAAQAEAVRSARIAETFGKLATSPEGQQLLNHYEAAHTAANQLFDLVGDVPPSLEDPQLVEQLTSLTETFVRYERLGLLPQLVLSREHKPLAYWVDLAARLEASSLNPTQPDNQKAVRNGGLYVNDAVRDNWTKLADLNNSQPAWNLHVISTLPMPHIALVTSYGYVDQANAQPSDSLNQLLSDLELPTIPERSGRKGQKQPLTQPPIHPTPELYVTTQLTRIIQNQEPLDTNTWSWLNGELASGLVPAGCWNSVDGQVRLDWNDADRRGSSIGVRPSGRGQA